jgi:hypothetical protein
VASLADDTLTRRQMMAALLAGGATGTVAPAGKSDSSDDDQPDEDALPLPESGPAPPPLVNRPAPKGYSPPYGPPPYGQPRSNVLAMALAGGAAQPQARQNPLATALAPSQAEPAVPPASHYAQLPGPPLLLAGAGDTGTGSQPQAAPAPALPAAAPGGAQSIGQGAAGAPQEDATTSSYRVEHDAAMTQFNALRAKGDAAISAGNSEAAKIYYAEATKAFDRANTVNDKAIEYNSSLSRPPNEKEAAFLTAAGENPLHYQSQKGKLSLIDQEEENSRLATAADVPPGVDPNALQVSPGNKLEAIPGTEKIPEIKAYEYDQKNREEMGLPRISFSDWNTQKTMYGKGERPLVDAAGREIDSSATGDELLQALPPAVANHAKAIAETREKWPTGTEQARQPQLQQALAAAQQLDPSLNQQTYQTRQQMRNSAESGSGRINVANLANNTAIFHSNSLTNAIVALNNSSNTVLNATINSAAGPAGGIISGAVNKADAVKQFDIERNAVANELERSFHGVGTTAEQAVLRQINDLSVNDAPQTQLGALKAAQDLLRGKITANEADYRDTMGDKNIAAWERDHGRPFGFITPAAQAAGDRVVAMYQSVKSGKGFHGFEPGTPQPQIQGEAAPPAPPAPRNVAPSVTGAPPRKGVYVPGKGIQFQ